MNYDAIVVLGGGVRQGGELPHWVRRRFDLALELWQGERIMTLSAGTPHRPPPLDEAEFPIFESFAGAAFLMKAGVPAEKILVETHSWDTIGNAWFSRVIHAEPLKLRRLLVITSQFHLRRTEAAFRWVYGLTPLPIPYELHFRAAADDGLDAEVLEARAGREEQSFRTIESLAREIGTVPEFHRWLFTAHEAYSAEGKAFRNPRLSGELSRLY
ncbi:MAG: YdcF family protein [Acidobacteriota bacterium]|nr:YdcF family protein [Acidobacteriota bacterium]